MRPEDAASAVIVLGTPAADVANARYISDDGDDSLGRLGQVGTGEPGAGSRPRARRVADLRRAEEGRRIDAQPPAEVEGGREVGLGAGLDPARVSADVGLRGRLADRELLFFPLLDTEPTQLADFDAGKGTRRGLAWEGDRFGLGI